MMYVVDCDGIVSHYVNLTLNDLPPHRCAGVDMFIREYVRKTPLLVPVPVDRERLYTMTLEDIELLKRSDSVTLLELRFMDKRRHSSLSLVIDSIDMLESIVAAAMGARNAPWMYIDRCIDEILDPRGERCRRIVASEIRKVQLGDIVRGLRELAKSGSELRVYAAIAYSKLSSIRAVAPRRRKYGFVPIIDGCVNYQVLRLLDIAYGDWRAAVLDLFRGRTDVCDYVDITENKDGSIYIKCMIGRQSIDNVKRGAKIALITHKKLDERRVREYIDEISSLLAG